MNFIGIDPGKNGGIAFINNTLSEITAFKIPDTQKDTYDLLQILTNYGDVFALLEKVHSSPQMGVVSSFTLGRGYGFLEGCLYASSISFDYVSPMKWQKYMGCLSKGVKNVTKTKAQQLFPKIKCTHNISDSLLIAEYARRTYKV
jgi:crossover junction endodeoxyribonuclease RuvC